MPNPYQLIANAPVGTHVSDQTLTLGTAGGDVIVEAIPSGSSGVVPFAQVYVLDAAQGGGPYSVVVDSADGLANGTAILTTTTKFVATGCRPFVKIKIVVTAGTWQVTATPTADATRPPGALYRSASTGAIPATNASTTLTVSLGTLESVQSGTIFDARQAMVYIANVNANQPVASGALVFSDTTIGGASLSISYPLYLAASSGNSGSQSVLLTQQVLKNVAVDLTFSVAPTAGQVDVIVYLQSAGGLGQDPTVGKTLLTQELEVSASGSTTVVGLANSAARIYVTSYSLVAAGAVTAQWYSGTAATPLTGQMSFAANGGISIATSVPSFIFATATGNGLGISLGGAVAVAGHVTYWVGT